MTSKPMNLWELMQKLRLEDVVDLSHLLTRFERLASSENGLDQEVIDKTKALIDRLMNPFYLEIGFEESVASIQRLKEALSSSNPLPSELKWKARNVFDIIKSEAEKRLIFLVPNNLKQFYNNDELLGKAVKNGYPSAIPDIKSAGNCIAFGNDTASVFHLMRVVELGLRAFSKHLGVKDVKISGKPGNEKYVPLAFSDWEKIIQAGQNKIDKINGSKRGPKRQKAQEFYLPLMMDFRAIKDAWRNHCMHTRAYYNSEDAMMIFSHVKRIMETLALNGITEV